MPRTKRTMEHEGDGNTNCNCCTWNNPQRLGKGTEKLRGQVEIIKTSALLKKTEKSPEDLRWLVVTRTSVKKKTSANASVKNSASCKIIWTCWTIDLAIPADHRVKVKENEKRDKYVDLARELKKTLRNMKVMVIPTVIGTLGTIPKSLVRRLEE